MSSLKIHFRIIFIATAEHPLFAEFLMLYFFSLFAEKRVLKFVFDGHANLIIFLIDGNVGEEIDPILR